MHLARREVQHSNACSFQHADKKSSDKDDDGEAAVAESIRDQRNEESKLEVLISAAKAGDIRRPCARTRHMSLLILRIPPLFFS